MELRGTPQGDSSVCVCFFIYVDDLLRLVTEVEKQLTTCITKAKDLASVVGPDGTLYLHPPSYRSHSFAFQNENLLHTIQMIFAEN